MKMFSYLSDKHQLDVCSRVHHPVDGGHGDPLPAHAPGAGAEATHLLCRSRREGSGAEGPGRVPCRPGALQAGKKG